MRINHRTWLVALCLASAPATQVAQTRAAEPAAYAGAESPWSYWQGTFVRRDQNGDVGCALAADGRSCVWWASGSAVPPAEAPALWCGNHHAQVWGSRGYDVPGHWCNKAYADLYAKWTSRTFGARTALVAVNPEGDAMCLSTNGAECEWNAQSVPGPVDPLVCGAVHEAFWGETGYDDPEHWCARTSPRRFTVAVTSDPQYPWLNEGSIPSSGNEEQDSKQSIPAQYASINKYHETRQRLEGVFINGDVTAFGHAWQWDYMNDVALPMLKPPIFMGLGNHDFENNVDDCYQNNCVRNSLASFEKYLPKDASIDRAKSYYYNDGADNSEFHGSYAWSKDIGNVHFVVLNNEPTYAFDAEGWNFSDGRRERFYISSAMRWLDKDLSAARAAGKAIVLVYHKRDDLEGTDGFGREKFEAFLAKYNVSLVFNGHYHTVGGQQKQMGGATSVLSGSATTQTYLIAEFDTERNLAQVYLSERGDIDHMEHIATVPLKRPKERVAPQVQAPYRVRFVNNGGYNAKFKLTYRNAGGNPVEEWTGSLPSGGGWFATVPAGATNVVMSGHALTGIAWNSFPEVFSQNVDGYRCLKTYGTTTSLKWGDC